MSRHRIPESVEVLKRTITLPDGTTVLIFIDLTPPALQRFAQAAADNKTRLANLCSGCFIAVVKE